MLSRRSGTVAAFGTGQTDRARFEELGRGVCGDVLPKAVFAPD